MFHCSSFPNPDLYLPLMASAEISVLALGASHISYARFSINPVGECVLHETVRQGLKFSPESAESWLEFLDEGLGSLAGTVKLKKVTAVLLPSWSVLSKGMQFTKVQGNAQDEVVRYEAGKSMPQGLNGHDWTYGLMADDGVECEAVVHAIQSDILDGLKSVLKKRGIKPALVDATVSGLVNAHGLNYASAGADSLVLDMGARSTTLLVTSSKGAPFLRNLSFGGAQITQHLVQELGVSFEEAEMQKLSWIRQKESNANLNEASERFVTRMVNEVQRSLTLYRRQTGKDNPGRILLLGGCSGLPGLADFLQKNTGIEVEMYNPFAHVVSGAELKGELASSMASDLAALVGVAVRATSRATLKTNFLEEATVSKIPAEQRLWLLVAAVLFLCAGLGVCLKPHMETLNLQVEVSRIERGLMPYESLAESVQIAFENYQSLLEEKNELKQISLGKEHWVAFLADLQQRMSEVEDVWLESIVTESIRTGEGEESLVKLRLHGSLLDRENPLSQVSSASRSRVEALLRSFGDSPFISAVKDRRFDTSQPGILRFDFSIVIQPEAAL